MFAEKATQEKVGVVDDSSTTPMKSSYFGFAHCLGFAFIHDRERLDVSFAGKHTN
jgi:hypothetical protein